MVAVDRIFGTSSPLGARSTRTSTRTPPRETPYSRLPRMCVLKLSAEGLGYSIKLFIQFYNKHQIVGSLLIAISDDRRLSNRAHRFKFLQFFDDFYNVIQSSKKNQRSRSWSCWQRRTRSSYGIIYIALRRLRGRRHHSSGTHQRCSRATWSVYLRIQAT